MLEFSDSLKPSALPSHASSLLGPTETQNSPSLRFDERASAEAKLALIMPSEEEKGGEAPNGCPKGRVVTQALQRSCSFEKVGVAHNRWPKAGVVTHISRRSRTI